MKKILTCIVAVLIWLPIAAADPAETEAAVRNALTEFNKAYGDNRVEAYFGYYATDASIYFEGARQTVSGYHDMWTALIHSGAAVERNDLSDIRVRVLPGGDNAVATYFIDYRLRGADGSNSPAKAFETDVWQRIDGKWKIVALHYSEIAPAKQGIGEGIPESEGA